MGDLLLKTQNKNHKKYDLRDAEIILKEQEFTWDGNEKIRVVDSVNINGKELIEGIDYVIDGNRAIDAGTHKIIVAAPGKERRWKIKKAQGILSLSSSSLSLIGIIPKGTINVSYFGDGEIKVSSSDESVAKVTYNNGVITVVGVKNGTATITATMNETNNIIAPTKKTCNVTVQVPSIKLEENSPGVIQAVARESLGENYWSIGDQTSIITIAAYANIAQQDTLKAFIIGFDHNSEKEGTGITFQIGKNTSNKDIAICDTGYGSSYTSTDQTWLNMNQTATNENGWYGSHMRTTLNSYYLPNSFPSSWRNYMKSVTKYTDNVAKGTGSVSSNVTSYNEKLFLLSEYEVFGSRSYCNTYEYSDGKQLQYTYYKNGNSRVKYRSTSTSSTATWWLRSPYASNSSYFVAVSTNGGVTYNTATVSYGIAPAFVIG